MDNKKILNYAKGAIIGGADLIQLRCKNSPTQGFIKTAKAIKGIAHKHARPFIVNDRIDVALAADADGIHIGQGDIDIRLARRLVGCDKIIGVSATDIKEARAAKASGADYIGAGPVFATPIKDERRERGLKLLGRVQELNIPFFAIGGINDKNINRLTEKGFRRAAVIRAVCKAHSPRTAAKILKEALAQ